MIPCTDETGKRTADLIHRYSMYMTALPIAASVTGVTSYMFAVEGMAINAYLLSLSKRFKDSPTIPNAQKIFMCSLWYLPAVLGLMIFHKQDWIAEADEKKNTTLDIWIQKFVERGGVYLNDDNSYLATQIADIRQRLKEVCVHEMLWGVKPNVSVDASILCPVAITDIARKTSKEEKKNLTD